MVVRIQVPHSAWGIWQKPQRNDQSTQTTDLQGDKLPVREVASSRPDRGRLRILKLKTREKLLTLLLYLSVNCLTSTKSFQKRNLKTRALSSELRCNWQLSMLPKPLWRFSGPKWNEQLKLIWQMKNTYWQEQDQFAINKRSQGVEPGNGTNPIAGQSKSFTWDHRILSPGVGFSKVPKLLGCHNSRYMFARPRN